MKEKRELIAHGYAVLLDAEVFIGPHKNRAVFVVTAEVPIPSTVSREEMLAWATELAGRMYADYDTSE